MTEKTSHELELEQNFEAFQKLLPELIGPHAGKFVLMRNREQVQVFDSAADALKYAKAQFEDGMYSVQQVTDHVVDLGYFSHAVHLGSV